MPASDDRLRELRIDRGELDTSRPSSGSLVALVAVLVLLVAAAAWWFFGRTRPPEVAVATAEAVDATQATASTVLDASGYVVARRAATVSSKVTGKVLEVNVEEGMRVAEGDVLARLDGGVAERQLALAAAQLTSARSAVEETRVRLVEADLALRRARELRAGQVASEADLDAALAARDALQARLVTAREEVAVAERLVDVRRQDLQDLVIRAPFSGVVVDKNAQEGEMISPISAGGGFTRTGICTLVDMSSLEIEVDVNEAYIQRVHPGQPVVAVLDAYPGWEIPAHVIMPVPTADRQKATVRVRIAFEELDPRILPEMGVKVSFLETKAADDPTAAPATAAVAVPAAALARRDDREVVFVVGAEETVERRAVTVGRRDEARVELLAGVRAGERVVLAPSAELADGMRVRVKAAGTGA